MQLQIIIGHQLGCLVPSAKYPSWLFFRHPKLHVCTRQQRVNVNSIRIVVNVVGKRPVMEIIYVLEILPRRLVFIGLRIGHIQL